MPRSSYSQTARKAPLAPAPARCLRAREHGYDTEHAEGLPGDARPQQPQDHAPHPGVPLSHRSADQEEQGPFSNRQCLERQDRQDAITDEQSGGNWVGFVGVTRWGQAHSSGREGCRGAAKVEEA